MAESSRLSSENIAPKNTSSDNISSDHAVRTAWLLHMGADCYGAVSQLHLKHLITHPKVFSLPDAPKYCNQLVIWSGQALPIMIMPIRLGMETQNPKNEEEPVDRRDTSKESILAVLSFQTSANVTPNVVAIHLESAPTRIDVHETQATLLPSNMAQWQPFSLSCFKQGSVGVIPIIDLPSVFDNDCR